MAKITPTSKIELSATITFNEQELRALEAITSYGHESFLRVFYTHMGTTYLAPYEKGIIELFESIRNQAPPILNKLKMAQEAFK